jgi:hypothetical protein
MISEPNIPPRTLPLCGGCSFMSGCAAASLITVLRYYRDDDGDHHNRLFRGISCVPKYQ